MSEKRKVQSEKLLQAAYDRVAEVGVSGLRTRDIAEGAGVNLATLHYCFENKEALIRALYRFILDKFRGDYVAIVGDRDAPANQMQAQTRLLIHFLRETPTSLQVWRAFTGEAWTNPIVRDILRSHFAERRDKIAGILNRGLSSSAFPGMPTADLTLNASLIMALHEGLLLQWSVDPEAFSPEAYANALHAWLGIQPGAVEGSEK